MLKSIDILKYELNSPRNIKSLTYSDKKVYTLCIDIYDAYDTVVAWHMLPPRSLSVLTIKTS